MMDWPEVYHIINTVGLPLTMLGFVLFVLWRAAVWAKKAVIEPLMEGHLKFLATMSDRISEQSERLREILEASRKQSEANEKLYRALTDQTTILKFAIEKLTTSLAISRSRHHKVNRDDDDTEGGGL